MSRKNILVTQRVQLFSSFLMCRIIHGTGFRLRDVEFLFNLINNWLYGNHPDVNIDIQLVQISRELERFLGSGYVLKKRKHKVPVFSLTPRGLGYIFYQMSNPEKLIDPDQVILIHYLLATYGKFFRSFLGDDDFFRSSAELQNIENFLNPQTILLNQIKLIQIRIKALEERIMENDEMLTYSRPD